MQSASTPILRSALGSAPVTSARPPVFAKGTISEETTRTFIARSPASLRKLPEVLGGLLRRGRVDVEPGTPLEPGHLRQLRHDLDVPVEKVPRPLLERGAVDDEVEGWIFEGEVQPPQGPPEDGGERFRLVSLDHLVGALVALRDDPGLEREAGSVRREGEEFPGLLDDADLLLHLLDDDVAEEASVAEAVILPAAVHLLHQPLRDDGK